MKIINSNNNLVRIKDVPLTGVFEYNNKIYLRTEEFYYETTKQGDSGDACAIDLHEGLVVEFDPDCRVGYFPNAELRLNGV